MKKIGIIGGCALAAFTPALFGQAAPEKVGVIQIQSAMISTKDGQKAVQELNARLQPRKAELDRKAAEIRDLQDRLQRGGPAMAETAKADLTRQIDAKTKSYNRDMQDAQDEYEQENRKLLQELSGRMTNVIDKYAVDHGYCGNSGREQSEHAGDVCLEYRGCDAGHYRSVRQDDHGSGVAPEDVRAEAGGAGYDGPGPEETALVAGISIVRGTARRRSWFAELSRER